MGLPYPGGPNIDTLASKGNPGRFSFPEPSMPGLDYSFSGLKTSFLYFVRDQLKEDPAFIENNQYDLAASIQSAIINTLMNKLVLAAQERNIREIAIAGGVSANSGLRASLKKAKKKFNWNIYIPEIQFCTDNAAMIAITGYFKYQKGEFSHHDVSPYSKSVAN
jgi:N6-L-threonylcarbamoyladenine synthase